MDRRRRQQVLLIAQLALDVISDLGRMWRGEGPPQALAPADTAKVS